MCHHGLNYGALKIICCKNDWSDMKDGIPVWPGEQDREFRNEKVVLDHT